MRKHYEIVSRFLWVGIFLCVCAFGWNQASEKQQIQEKNALLCDAIALTGTAALFAEYSEDESKWVFSNWDANAESIFLYKPDEIIGKSITDIMPKSKRGAHSDRLDAAMVAQNERPDFVYQVECSGLRKDGTTIPIHLRTRYLPSHNRFLTLIDAASNVVTISGGHYE